MTKKILKRKKQSERAEEPTDEDENGGDEPDLDGRRVVNETGCTMYLPRCLPPPS